MDESYRFDKAYKNGKQGSAFHTLEDLSYQEIYGDGKIYDPLQCLYLKGFDPNFESKTDNHC